MIDETLEDDAIRFALGSLSPAERTAFTARMETNAELRRYTHEMTPVIASLSLAASPVSPPPAVLGRILAEVRPSPIFTQNIFARSWLPWALAACFALACTILALQQRRLHQQLAELQQRDAFSQMQIATLTAQIGSYSNVAAVVVWNTEKRRGIARLKSLPALDAQHDYQLWVIDPSAPGPVSAGLVHADQSGSARVAFEPASAVHHATQFALSVEPKGGGPAPRGQIVLAGN